MNTDVKILNKILANQIQCYIKGSHTIFKWDLFYGWFNTHKSINVIHHMNKSKGKTHISNPTNTKRKKNAFVRIQHPFMIKTLIKKTQM